MEFNSCTVDADLTNFEYIKKNFNEKGYKLPRLVFWNVNSLQQQVPVKETNREPCLFQVALQRYLKWLWMGKKHHLTISYIEYYKY